MEAIATKLEAIATSNKKLFKESGLWSRAAFFKPILHWREGWRNVSAHRESCNLRSRQCLVGLLIEGHFLASLLVRPSNEQIHFTAGPKQAQGQGLHLHLLLHMQPYISTSIEGPEK